MRSIKIVKVAKPRTPSLVAVPASRTSSKRVCRYFRDREKALAYIISVKQQGFLSAEGQGTSPSNSKVTLGKCAALWIARHKQLRMAFFQVRQVLNRLVARHGRDPISSVTDRELDAWLRSLHGLTPVTQHNYWRITRRFFNFAAIFSKSFRATR